MTELLSAITNIVIPSVCILVIAGLYIQRPHYKHQILMCVAVFVTSIVTLGIVSNVEMAIAVEAVCLIIVGSWIAIRLVLRKYYRYNYIEGKTTFFQKKKVMVFVPHEDDELNLVSDILERYLQDDSQVYIVYATNGDYCDFGKTRMQEAVRVCKEIGVEEKNVIFLGYGDQWQEYEDESGKQIKHIYHASENRMMKSHIGYEETYALENHKPFRDKHSYTRGNYLKDIKDVILEYRPDVIYAVDYDPHSDHRAAGLLFEEALGNILKEDSTYKPKVYKGFCYSTAYYAADDFKDNINIKSTVSLSKDKYMEENRVYCWEERVRVPVCIQNISRDFTKCKTYRLLAKYTTQPALEKAGRIINGDKVFFERYTTSVLYDAKISDKKNIITYLNDFKLLESYDIMKKEDVPYQRYWKPSEQMLKEQQAVLKVELPKKKAISEIWIYGHPSNTAQILDARVCIDGERTYHTGAFSQNGQPVKVKIHPEEVKTFEIILDKWQGQEIGIVEIEAYESSSEEEKLAYIKIKNAIDDFAYHELVNKEEQLYQIYAYPNCVKLQNCEKYSIRLRENSKGCSVRWENNNIYVTCPKKRKCILEVSSKDNPAISDAIVIENISGIKKRLINHIIRCSVANTVLYYKTLLKSILNLIKK